jgi:hypothetical protein
VNRVGVDGTPDDWYREWTATADRIAGIARESERRGHIVRANTVTANTVTAYLLQQIQLLAHRDRHGLAPWSATGNRSAGGTGS